MNIYHFHAFFCQEIDIKDSPLLTRIFEFLEPMAGSRDPEVVLVAGGNGVAVLAQRVQRVTTTDLKGRSARGALIQTKCPYPPRAQTTFLWAERPTTEFLSKQTGWRQLRMNY